MSASADIAIAMPIGRWHPMLPAAFRSIQLQTPHIELAILDASGDSRIESLISALGVKVAYYRKGTDNGQASAIAEGWNNTQSSFVGWLNADDVLFPCSLDRLLRVINTEGTDVAYGDSTIVAEDGSTIGVHGQVSEVTDKIFVSNCISQPSTLIRRSSLEAIGGINEGLNYTMDWDIWRRLYLAGGRFSRIGDVLSAVHWGTGTKTSQVSAARVIEYFKLVNVSNGLFSALKSVTASTLQTAAFNAQSRKPTTKKKGIFAAADYNPRETGLMTRLIPVINLSESYKHQIEINTVGSRCRIAFDSSLEKHELAAKSSKIPLEKGVPPGDTVTLNLEALAAGSTRFLGAKLS